MMHGGQYVWLWKEGLLMFRMDCFVTCPGLQRGDQELFAEPQKFLGFFDVVATAGHGHGIRHSSGDDHHLITVVTGHHTI